MNTTWVLVVAGVLFGGFLLVASRYISLWLQAYVSGIRIGLLSLMLMSLRKVDPRVVVQCKVMAVQAGLDLLPTDAIDLAGRDIIEAVQVVPQAG